MRKRILFVVALMAAGAVGASLAFVIPSSAAGGTKHKEFTLYEKSTHDHAYQADQGDHGFSVGDYEVGHEPLFRHHKRTAVLSRVCHNIRVHRSTRASTLQCDGVISLKGGTLTFLGRIAFGPNGGSNTLHLAITGGTGTYRDASGTVTLDFNQSPAPVDFSIDY
ncbi:MAG: Dirigent-like protein [Actinomycetota bacterium]|nr:Dirigent-like protein [Actinomycetota bacterium]MEA2486839.1 Dirigent-like protein [Actinomycetota bacterium]